MATHHTLARGLRGHRLYRLSLCHVPLLHPTPAPIPPDAPPGINGGRVPRAEEHQTGDRGGGAGDAAGVCGDLGAGEVGWKRFYRVGRGDHPGPAAVLEHAQRGELPLLLAWLCRRPFFFFLVVVVVVFSGGVGAAAADAARCCGFSWASLLLVIQAVLPRATATAAGDESSTTLNKQKAEARKWRGRAKETTRREIPPTYTCNSKTSM